MNRGLNYYLNTVLLKMTGLAYAIVEKAGGLDGYKNRLLKRYKRNYPDSETAQKSAYSSLYLSYCFFDHPDELGWTLSFDKEGVAKSSRQSIQTTIYNPLFPAYYALVCFNHFVRRGDEESLRQFWKQVHFLESIGEETPNGFFLWIDIPVPAFQLSGRFYNGITQALCLSCFIRAYQLSGEEKYKILSGQIVKTLFIPYEEGGVLFYTEEGMSWILEYPSGAPPLVLNGFITAIIGFLEYHHTMDASGDEETLRALFKSLWLHLPDFQRGRYFKYAMAHNRLSNISYRGLYPALFLHLHHLTRQSAFLEMAQSQYGKVPWERFFRFYRIPPERAVALKKYFFEG